LKSQEIKLSPAGDRRYPFGGVAGPTFPASSVAINLANLQVPYKLPKDWWTVAYVFLITRARRHAHQGELCLTAKSGAVVPNPELSQEKPSILREARRCYSGTALRDGVADLRVTHLSVDTRLVDCRLIIRELPR